MGKKEGEKKRVGRAILVYFAGVGVLAHLFVFWMAAGWPLFFDRWLIENNLPRPAEYIVCLTAGIGSSYLPTEDGWGRIYTASQLYFDGFAPRILFTGGGAERVSEAEIYAEVARWFGCPEEAIFYEIGAASTADHPRRLLEMEELKISRTTRFLIVTSSLHSRRTALCFRKQGFSNFQVISRYQAKKIVDPQRVRELRLSRFPSYEPSGKAYKDVLFRLRFRSSYFWAALREVAALVVYKLKGYI